MLILFHLLFIITSISFYGIIQDNIGITVTPTLSNPLPCSVTVATVTAVGKKYQSLWQSTKKALLLNRKEMTIKVKDRSLSGVAAPGNKQGYF